MPLYKKNRLHQFVSYALLQLYHVRTCMHSLFIWHNTSASKTTLALIFGTKRSVEWLLLVPQVGRFLLVGWLTDQVRLLKELMILPLLSLLLLQMSPSCSLQA